MILYHSKNFVKSREKSSILCHHKNFLIGDYLIDDRKFNGAENFDGEWLHFGSDKFPNWKSVLKYLFNEISL